MRAAALRVGNAAALPPVLRDAVRAVSADALAGVTAASLTIQADALLNATDAKNITDTAKVQQSDAQITDYVAAHRADLTGTPSAAAVAAMNAELTQQVAASQGAGGGNGGGEPRTAEGTLLLCFGAPTPAFSDMGGYGGALPSVAGPAGGSGNALKILKPASPDTWGGTYFTMARIPFTAERKVLTARVYATRANAVITLKVEVPGGNAVEVQGTPAGAANTWTTVSWNLAAVNPALSYTVIAITPDVDRVTDGQAYWIDNLTLAPAAMTPPPTGGDGTLLLSFDESTPAFSDMGAYGALPSVEPARPAHRQRAEDPRRRVRIPGAEPSSAWRAFPSRATAAC